MSERPDPPAQDAVVGPHGQPSPHRDTDGHDEVDVHGAEAHGAGAAGSEAHAGEALGPIDVAAWGAATLGVALGLLVLLAFTQALS